MNSPSSAPQAGNIGYGAQETTPRVMANVRVDSMQDRAKSLAKVLADAGIVNDEPMPKASGRALQAAYTAYFAIGAGDMTDWLYIMELRRSPFYPRKESDRQFAALCSRALKHPDLPDNMIQEVAFAWGYFSAKSET